MIELDEIHGFRSPGEYQRFLQFLADQVHKGNLKEVAPDPEYHKGEIYGGRWFSCTDDGSVWRLIPPDAPFYGLFEKIEA